MGVLHFTDESFEEEVLKYEGVVLVDFWAPWCGPCMALAPTIENVANQFDGKAKVGKVNVDEESGLAEKYMIMSIPSILVFKDGQVVDTLVGLRPITDYSEAVERVL